MNMPESRLPARNPHPPRVEITVDIQPLRGHHWLAMLLLASALLLIVLGLTSQGWLWPDPARLAPLEAFATDRHDAPPRLLAKARRPRATPPPGYCWAVQQCARPFRRTPN